MNTTETVQEHATALKIRTILVAVDLFPHSERTVDYAISIARRFGASLKVLHVYTPPSSIEFCSEDVYRLLYEGRRDAERHLRNLTDQKRAIYPKCEALLTTGDPAEQVARAADIMRADLIVIGRHHQTSVGRLFKLDQAPKIVHRVTCPVLVSEDDHE